MSLEEFRATRKKLHSTKSNLAAECLDDRIGWVYLYGNMERFGGRKYTCNVPVDHSIDGEWLGYIEITGRGYEVQLERHIETYEGLWRAEEVLHGWFKREGYFTNMGLR